MRTLICIFLIIFFSQEISSQTLAITQKGDTIQINDNGTWERLRSKKTIPQILSNVKTTVKVDEFEKTKSIDTELWDSFGRTEKTGVITGNMFKYKDLVYFSLILVGIDLGCLSEYTSTIKVKLTSGDVVEFSQVSDTDCGNYPSGRFIPLTREQLKLPQYQQLLTDNLELLKSYDWETIRITGSKYYTDIKPYQSKKIQNPSQFFRQHLIAIERE
jgi:hypothetical protein